MGLDGFGLESSYHGTRLVFIAEDRRDVAINLADLIKPSSFPKLKRVRRWLLKVSLPTIAHTIGDHPYFLILTKRPGLLTLEYMKETSSW